MLTERLIARCPSARSDGVACAEGYGLDFSKPGADGSGKATLTPSPRGITPGIVYMVDACDLASLDQAESGYNRIDDFPIAGRREPAVTYIAEQPQSGLAPYDWYLALIIAGAREHGLGADYIASLRAHPYTDDKRPECAFRTQAHQALQMSGHRSVRDALE